MNMYIYIYIFIFTHTHAYIHTPYPHTQIEGRRETGVCVAPEWDLVQDEGVAGQKEGQSRKHAGGKLGTSCSAVGLHQLKLQAERIISKMTINLNFRQPCLSCHPDLSYFIQRGSFRLLQLPEVKVTKEVVYLFILG